MENFISDRPLDNDIDHINHNTKHNCVCNLRYLHKSINRADTSNLKYSGTIRTNKNKNGNTYTYRYYVKGGDGIRKSKTYKTKEEAECHMILNEILSSIS